MMNIKYYKDYRHNYLIIGGNHDYSENKYQKKMIIENQIKGLLPCQERHINGETLLYYEITSKQSLLHIFDRKSIGIDELRQLIMQLKVVNDLLQKYLLYGNHLILGAEFIFQNIETGEYGFLYYPGEEEANLNQLIDFLIARVNNEDTKAVEMVYKAADLIQRDLFALDEILEWFPEEIKAEDSNKQYDNNRRYDYEERNPVEGTMREPYDLPKCKEEASINKPSRFTSFFKKIFCKKSKHQEKFFQPAPERYVQTAEIQDRVMREDYGNTVFIPWTESCENKLYGMERGNKYHIDLTQLPITVGKLAGAVDMVIKEQSISRMHARFTRDKNKTFIMDLNSTNGTFRNGMRLEPNASEVIEPGDEIRLGKLKFIYR